MTGGDTPRQRMDRIYRLQRFVYDPTRRWYLLGRDRLIEALDPPAGGHVLEIACGTGRNLVRIGERYPSTWLYGADVSAEMLKSARTNRNRAGLHERMALTRADAMTLEPAALFPDGPARFERVVISYALSMIPSWQAAIDRALEALAPGGTLHVADFGDMAGLPRALQRGLKWWLARFHVTPRPEAAAYLHQQAETAGHTNRYERIAAGYTWIARVETSAPLARLVTGHGTHMNSTLMPPGSKTIQCLAGPSRSNSGGNSTVTPGKSDTRS